MRFNGQVALVTGGGRGIGRAISERLLGEGARVAFAQRSAPENPPPGAEFIRADLADAAACQAAVEQTASRLGGLDILVNNAGMMIEAGVGEMGLEHWSRTIAVNLTAPFLLIKHALPYLRARPGAIVNIGSIEGLGSNPGHAAYGASKAGLHGLTRAVAIDHGGEGIRCNAVAPGWIDTELNTEFVASLPDPGSVAERLKVLHPVGHTGEPEDVATLVAWLASDDARFVTGEVYRVDGGRMAKLSLP